MSKVIFWFKQPQNVVLLGTVLTAVGRAMTGAGNWMDAGMVALAAMLSFKHAACAPVEPTK